MPRAPAPFLIERALLIEGGQPAPAQVEDLVGFQRDGHRVVLVAPRPARWRPTRRSVDHDLALQQQIHRMVTRAGADIDGVLYVSTGLFSRRQTRRDEFARLAERYDHAAPDLTLIGTDPALLEAAGRAGLRVLSVGDSGPSNSGHFNSLRGALMKGALEGV